MGAPRRWGALASLVCGCLSVVIAQQAKIRNEVTGYLGKSVVLPCTFVPSSPEIQVSQVTWVKEDGGRRPNLAVYHPRHGPSYPMEKNSRRIRFRTESLEDATLVIQHLLMTDEDMYTCEFATFPNGNEYRITNLTVLATPTSSAWAEEVKAGGVEQPAATCMATDGKPPARITWLSRLNGNASVVQVANPNGTFTVISHYHVVPTKEANEQQITCLVEHTTLPQPEALTVQLSVLYAPEVTIEGYDDNWYLSRTEAVLTCNAKGNPPPKDFLWTTSSGSLPRSAEVQGPRLVVRNMDYSANTTFVCQATNRVGQVTSQQVVLVREKPNMAGAATTGGVIGGIIAAIVALSVITTGILVCRQQQKNQMDHEEEDDFEGPPAYKPPPPCQLSDESEPVPNPTEAENIPLKSPYFQPSITDDLFGGVSATTTEKVPRYHELPTLEEREATSEAGPSLEDDYLDQINPIYDALSYVVTEEEAALTPMATDKAFVMSRAMYV